MTRMKFSNVLVIGSGAAGLGGGIGGSRPRRTAPRTTGMPAHTLASATRSRPFPHAFRVVGYLYLLGFPSTWLVRAT